MKTVHMYYYDPKRLDLHKLREQAEEISKGDSRNAPRPVVIHHHAAGQTSVCAFADGAHEFYKVTVAEEEKE